MNITSRRALRQYMDRRESDRRKDAALTAAEVTVWCFLATLVLIIAADHAAGWFV